MTKSTGNATIAEQADASEFILIGHLAYALEVLNENLIRRAEQLNLTDVARKVGDAQDALIEAIDEMAYATQSDYSMRGHRESQQ